MGGISIWQLLILLVIVLLLFGTKRLRNLGSDLGSAIKGFKGAMTDAQKDGEQARLDNLDKEQKDTTIEGKSTREKDHT